MLRRPLIIISTLMVLHSPIYASGFPDTYAFGSRALSLGGAFTAVADDYSAAFYNPAGLAQLSGNQITIDYLYTSPKIDVKTLDGQDLVIRLPDGQTKNDPTQHSGGKGFNLAIPILGIALDVNKMANLPFHVQVGVGASLPEKFSSVYRVNSNPPDQPQLFRYGDDIDRLHAAISVGIEVIKDLLYVGGGCQAMLYGEARIHVDGMNVTTDPEKSQTVSEVSIPAILKFDPVAGLLFTPMNKKLKIGVSFREKQELEITPVSATLTIDGLPDATLAMIMGIKSFFNPREYSLGCSYDFGGFMLSGEVNLQEWSDYRYSRSHTAQDSTGKPYFEGDPDFSNTVNYRLGIEYRLNKKTSLMLGYCHQPTPIPNQSGRITNYIDMDKDMVSLGGQYSLSLPSLLSKPLTLNGVIQYQKLKEYTVNKDGISGDNGGVTWIDQESYKVSGDAYAFGISMGLSW